MENLTLSENIIAVLDSVCEKMGIAVDWTAKNVMPELQRLMDCLVAFEMAKSIMWLCLCVAVIVAYGIVIWRVTRAIRKKETTLFVESCCGYEPSLAGYIVLLIGGILSVIAVFGVIDNMISIIECCTFPELVVIDYITSYIGE